MTRSLTAVLAAALVGVAAGAAALGAPAHAAACAGGQGVTVVVGSSVGCDPDGGGRASNNVADAGHRLTFASRSPGFVCRVDGAPAADPCVDASPADAYWALFWSDGTSGAWAYANLGITALKVPQGGSVALVFQTSSTRTWPSVPPAVVAPPPTQAATGAPPAGGSTGSSPARRKEPERAPSTRSAPRAVPSQAPSKDAASMPAPTASARASAPTSSAPTPTPTTASATSEQTAAAPIALPSSQARGPDGTSTAAVATGLGVLALLAGAAAWALFGRRRG